MIQVDPSPHGANRVYLKKPTIDPSLLVQDEDSFETFWPEDLPDYLNDLNAMHEAEKRLTDEQLADMAEWIGVDDNEAPAKSWRILLRATAAKRAKAFLRTLNLWTE